MMNEDSPFNEEDFMGAGTEEEGATSLPPIPAGTYPAVIEEMKLRTGTSKKDGKPWKALDITYLLTDTDETIKTQIGRDPRVTQSYFVDVNSAGGYDYSKDKNVRINQVREAVGQNVAKPGAPWKPYDMKGQPITVVVTEDPAKDSDAIYNRIKSVGVFT